MTVSFYMMTHFTGYDMNNNCHVLLIIANNEYAYVANIPIASPSVECFKTETSERCDCLMGIPDRCSR